MNDEQFFERLRTDAAALRYEPENAVLVRIRARIRSRIGEPSVAQLLAAWFRPLAAGLLVLTVASGIGIALAERNDTSAPEDFSIEVNMAGASYLVGN